MTALSSASSLDPKYALAGAVATLQRAKGRIGSRAFAHDLLEGADQLERALGSVSSELRLRFADGMPREVRYDLDVLWRATMRAADLGRSAIGIVPRDIGDPVLLAMDIDEWTMVAEAVMGTLGEARELA